MSPHPRYHSFTLAFLARRLDAIRDRTQALMRHAKLMTRWSAEAALFPFYKFIQTQKQLGRGVQQAFTTLGKVLQPTKTEVPDNQVPLSTSAAISNLLKTIEIIPAPTLNQASREQSQRLIVRVRPQSGSSFSLSSLKARGIQTLETIQRFFLRPAPSEIQTTGTQTTESNGSKQSKLIRSQPQSGLLAWIARGSRGLFQTVQTVCRQADSKQGLKTQSGLSHSTQLVNNDRASLKIQGVASLLGSRTIVLVTPDQEILDILSPSQQTLLFQRMMQELAIQQWHQRYHHILGTVTQLFIRVRAPQFRFTRPLNPLPFKAPLLAQNTPQPWTKAKKWIIRTVVGAIATLPMVAIPAIAAEPQPKPQQPQSLHPLENLWIDPNHLKKPLVTESHQSLVTAQAQGQKGGRHFPTNTANESISLTDISKQTNLLQNSRSPGPDHTISVNAEFLGYEPHMLERILGWLDQAIGQLESLLAMSWSIIGIAIIFCLSSVDKLRQRISD